jgi:hypothetical protein
MTQIEDTEETVVGDNNETGSIKTAELGETIWELPSNDGRMHELPDGSVRAEIDGQGVEELESNEGEIPIGVERSRFGSTSTTVASMSPISPLEGMAELESPIQGSSPWAVATVLEM